jgi:spermidine synthase
VLHLLEPPGSCPQSLRERVCDGTYDKPFIVDSCYRRLHSTAVTVIDINAAILALREEFRIPVDDERFRVIRADGSAYVAHLPPCKDVILVDACDGRGIAPQLDALEFYQNTHHCLARGGVSVSNLCGDWKCCASHLRKIRDVYGEDFLALRVRSARNVIVGSASTRPGPHPPLLSAP